MNAVINESPALNSEMPEIDMTKKSQKEILFSFKGRMCRIEFWGRAFPFLFPYSLIVIMIMNAEINSSGRIGLISIILTVIFLWPLLAVWVKRLHDRNHSAWYLLILLIPITVLWIIFEVGFLKGTEGINRYGQNTIVR